ncbi:hypothetical protein EV193_102692 [Herbihabitans rhizosphaerae]|uniref:Uncharacterized protein n=1 Tax=Herbihabitans rhizosphaerae TaxID=1872711 RepID=A0A4Q7L5A8_9PSEU|nr:hypothetical protein [Herbihabitans rhizosphaerae]RZS43711.1 hypothetical protein EV193_102692 [Herbihabitans rhizosphaerae]
MTELAAMVAALSWGALAESHGNGLGIAVVALAGIPIVWMLRNSRTRASEEALAGRR